MAARAVEEEIDDGIGGGGEARLPCRRLLLHGQISLCQAQLWAVMMDTAATHIVYCFANIAVCAGTQIRKRVPC